jgi:hypothetical protein
VINLGPIQELDKAWAANVENCAVPDKVLASLVHDHNQNWGNVLSSTLVHNHNQNWGRIHHIWKRAQSFEGSTRSSLKVLSLIEEEIGLVT